VTRVDSILHMNRERLRGSRYGWRERRPASLFGRRGGQLEALDAEERRSSRLTGRHPAEHDAILLHLALQSGNRRWTGPGGAVSGVRRSGGLSRMVPQGNLVAQQMRRTMAQIGGQCVRIGPSCSGRQIKGSDGSARPAFDRAAYLNRDRMLEGNVVGSPRRHWQVEAGGLRCGRGSTAGRRARNPKRESENQQLAIHALPT
jgi:hypothetical protein